MNYKYLSIALGIILIGSLYANYSIYVETYSIQGKCLEVIKNERDSLLLVNYKLDSANQLLYDEIFKNDSTIDVSNINEVKSMFADYLKGQ